MLSIKPVLCYSSAMVDGLLSITDELRFQEILQQKDRCIAALEGDLFTLKEQLAWLKKQIFGAKSERIVANLDTQPFLDLDFGSPRPEKATVPASVLDISYEVQYIPENYHDLEP